MERNRNISEINPVAVIGLLFVLAIFGGGMLGIAQRGADEQHQQHQTSN